MVSYSAQGCSKLRVMVLHMEHRGAGMALGVRELCTEMEGLPLLVKALMLPLTLAL